MVIADVASGVEHVDCDVVEVFDSELDVCLVCTGLVDAAAEEVDLRV